MTAFRESSILIAISARLSADGPASMLATEDQEPTHARVMKVVPAGSVSTTSSAALPVSTIPDLIEHKVARYEADYASITEDETSGDVTAAEIEEDDGWDLVPSRKNSAS